MTTPEVRINFSWLLFYDEVQKLKGDYKLESHEQFEEWTTNYRQAWRKREAKILPALQDCLGVTFYKPVIDVALAPFFRCKSDPLIINFRNEPDQFVDVLTHELCHVLLTDNNKLQLGNDETPIDLEQAWQGLFGKEHDFHTLVHIPVHAICKYIYLDILKEPQRLSRDMDTVKTYAKAGDNPYTKAWEYVEKHDYKQLIADLKQSYEEIKV